MHYLLIYFGMIERNESRKNWKMLLFTFSPELVLVAQRAVLIEIHPGRLSHHRLELWPGHISIELG